MLRDDYRAKSLVSSVERKVYEFAGPIFYGPRRGAVVEYYETICITCELNGGFKFVVHFVVFARYRDYVGIL